jgi:hypothetical protein
MSKISALTVLVLFTSFSVLAQFQGKVYEQFQNAVVSHENNVINSPWCGGINSVQINHADLNNDGKNDLILFDQNNFFYRTFINTGAPNTIKYTYSPQYEKNFPSADSYVQMRDYNCDGIPDLFYKRSLWCGCL